MSINKACAEVGIGTKRYCKWKKQAPLLVACNPNARTICKGRTSVLAPIEKDLLKYIFELREQGMAVNNGLVVIKAKVLLRIFREKSY